MVRSLEIYKLIIVNKALDKLIEQDLNYPINIAYKLSKSKIEIDKAVEYIMERINIVCGDNIDFTNLPNNRVLRAIFSQTVDVDLPDLTIDEIISNENVKLSVTDVERLEYLFSEK